MPVFGGESQNLSPHIQHFVRVCLAKGATKRKAEEWAMRQVRKGKRRP